MYNMFKTIGLYHAGFNSLFQMAMVSHSTTQYGALY